MRAHSVANNFFSNVLDSLDSFFFELNSIGIYGSHATCSASRTYSSNEYSVAIHMDSRLLENLSSYYWTFCFYIGFYYSAVRMLCEGNLFFHFLCMRKGVTL